MTTAIAPRDNYQNLRQLLAKAHGPIAQVLPKYLTADRLTAISLSAASRNPQLLVCTPESVLKAVMDCAKLGLEPTGKYGGAYLIPYYNKNLGRYEAQMQTSYHGEMKLARRSGDVSTIRARLVYERDEFSISYGDDERIEHSPSQADDRGTIVGVYAIARMKDGELQREYLRISEVEKRRGRSKAKDLGPWVTDYEAMVKKTAIRALCNMLPMAVEYTDQVEQEEHVELGLDAPIVTVVPEDIEASEPIATSEEPSAGVAATKDRIKKQKAAQAEIEPTKEDT